MKKIKLCTLLSFFVLSFQSFGAEIRMEWKKNPLFKKYKIQISTSKKSKKRPYEKIVKGNKIKWRTKRTGALYIRVAVVDEHGQVGKFSKRKKVIIKNKNKRLKITLNNPPVKFYRFNYKVEEEESLLGALRKFIRPNLVLDMKSASTVRTMEKNESIEDEEKLEKGSKVVLNIDRSVADVKAIREYFAEKKKKGRRYSWSLNAAYGKVDIENNTSNTSLSMNFIKVGGGINYKLKNNYSVKGTLSGVNFRDITYSEALTSVSSDSFYSEFGISLSKRYPKFSVAVAYDLLNYFVTSNENDTAKFEPKAINRLSVKPFYPIGKTKASLFGGLGYIKNLNDISISGYDFSFGAGYSVKMIRKFNVALVGYYSSLDVAGNDESSNAVVLSFGLPL